MQVGIVLDRGLGGIANRLQTDSKTLKQSQKRLNRLNELKTDSQDSKQAKNTQNCLKTLIGQFLTLNRF